MMDQAEKLRQIIDNLKLRQDTERPELPSLAVKKNARVITVTSGKGGVGKTNVTVNLAVALSEMGIKVAILDADFGLANIDVLFGIVPKYTLVDVIHQDRSIVEVLADGPNNIKFISGGSGVEELVRMDSFQIERFVENISMLDGLADVILIDTGAGLSDCVMSFIMAADEVLLITTPEPTSITDAYALIKMVSNRNPDKMIRVIVNRAENAREAHDILNKLYVVADKFLKIKLELLGYILQDEMVIRAVKLQQPFLLSYPKSQASKLIREISKKLLDAGEEAEPSANSGFKGFVNRLVNYLGG